MSLSSLVFWLCTALAFEYRFVYGWSLTQGVTVRRHQRKPTKGKGGVILMSSNQCEMDIKESTSPMWCPEKQIYVGGVVPDSTQVQSLIAENGGQLRIFGYGSLCWNPGQGAVLSHQSVTRTLGRARGYKRCWAQKSADHRGTPSFPGIVCTLLTDEEFCQGPEMCSHEPRSMTEGVLYTVPPDLVEKCLAELDFREKGGYARDVIDVVEDQSGEAVKALLYRGTPDNPAFWKRALLDLPFAAATMAVSVGPSGPNDEYLYHLDRFLKDAAASSEAAAAALLDHTGDNDTGSLAGMVRHLKQKELYFLFGSGSNQHNQLLLDSASNGGLLVNGDEARELMEIVLSVPKSIAHGSSDERRPKQLFAGGGHSALLTFGGELFLWGWNECGQLGCQNHAERGTSTSSMISQLDGIKVEAASLGHSHTLIIEKGTGTLFAFGDNARGQVSEGLNKASVFEPTVPLSVAREKFVEVSAGLFHSAAITTEGDLVTFGSGKFGQCIEKGSKWRPRDGSRLVKVCCGRRHTVLLDERGRVWTLGDNKYGQLGRSPHVTSQGNKDSQPRLVDGFPKGSCTNIVCGWSHTVATVTDEKGHQKLYGWGRNDKGQLGTGSRESLLFPTVLFSEKLSSTSSVSCGSEFTFVLDTSGTFFACGWNEHGTLSLSSTEDTLLLTEVLGAKVTAPPSCGDVSEKIFAAGGAHFLTTIA